MTDISGKRPQHDWLWTAEVVRWLDGDTVVVLIDRGFKDRSLRHIRLLGIDTPETRSKLRWGTRELAKQATERAIALSPVGSEVMVRSYKPGKYGGRWLGEIWPADKSEERSVNQIMLDEGLARSYPK